MILQAQLSALEEEGQAHIVSSPTITTLNNIQAYIESGREIPYQSSSDNTGTNTEFKKAVLRLEVTPHVVDNTLVKLEVLATNDEPDRTIVNSDLEPAIITRKTETTVLLQHGQTTVIAGLSKEFISEGDSGIPVLKDLPYLGAMFRSTLDEVELSDLLIFITPYIIDPENEDLYPENQLLKEPELEENTEAPEEAVETSKVEEATVEAPEVAVPAVAETTEVEIPAVESPEAAPTAKTVEMEAPTVETVETPAVEATEVVEPTEVEAPAAEVVEPTEVEAPAAEVVEPTEVEAPAAEAVESTEVEASVENSEIEDNALEPETVNIEVAETNEEVENIAYPSSPDFEAESAETDVVEDVTETTESMEEVETE